MPDVFCPVFMPHLVVLAGVQVIGHQRRGCRLRLVLRTRRRSRHASAAVRRHEAAAGESAAAGDKGAAAAAGACLVRKEL